MRVMLVTGSFPPEHCGVGDYTRQLALALAKYTSAEIQVLTGMTGERQVEGYNNLVELAANWRLPELPRFVRVILSHRPDLLHIQYPSQGFKGLMPSALPIFCRMLGIKVVQTWHEPYNCKQTPLFLMQLLGANGLIFVRPNYRELLPRFFRRLLRLRPQVFIPNAASLPIQVVTPVQRDEQRKRMLGQFKRLVMFFGFLYPSKGVESLFEIADPAIDMLVIAGGIKDDTYLSQLREVARQRGWSEDQVRFTGFLAADDAAALLAAADAVVLPFLNGGGEWNTSIHAALAQGTLVITTSTQPRGYDPDHNLYTAAPTAIGEMRNALNRLAGCRRPPATGDTAWQEIAMAHWNFYQNNRVLGRQNRS